MAKIKLEMVDGELVPKIIDAANSDSSTCSGGRGSLTIWKYPIDVTDEQSLDIPWESEILCVQMQHGRPFVWVLCDPNGSKKKRKIFVYGTGHPIEEEVRYIGTFQLQNGSLVFHVFEPVQ